MAPLPPVPQVLRVAFSGTINNSPFQCGVHMQYAGSSPTTAALNALATTWSTTWDTAFKTMYPTATALRTVEIWDLTAPSGAYGSANVNKAGTLVGGGLSNQTALCISWKVNYRWRGGHPRMYLPPPTSAETSGGNLWSVAFQSTAQTQARSFLANMNATVSGGMSFNMVAVKYIENKVPMTTPRVLAVADAIVHARLDSQRRRLGKETI